MGVSQNDAAAALEEIAAAEARTILAQAYAKSSPHFIIWGVITFLCYGASDVLSPAGGGFAWLAGSLVGVFASVVVARRSSKAALAKPYFASLFAFAIFIGLTLLLLPPPRPEAESAFISLVFSLAYVLMGLWTGARMLATGLALAALTVGGYLVIGQHFYLYMAVVTGGALVLAGIWLRRV